MMSADQADDHYGELAANDKHSPRSQAATRPYSLPQRRVLTGDHFRGGRDGGQGEGDREHRDKIAQ
ncbi:hypothetical protein, partial [Nonomuraea dietziae]|uniref:hypothetical protein n=1 Tax=Nonomuraea dietziae TaxID=65515 RepID=UPI0035E9916A